MSINLNIAHRPIAVWRTPASLLLMVASGFAGLGYQLVWTQQSALWLGHESAAVLAVVAAFFGGLAAGALLMGPLIERSSHPLRWYAACEATIGLWSLLIALFILPFNGWMLELIGVQPSPLWQWTISFFGTFLLLLPATAAMGATLPAMERVTAQMRLEGRSIAAFYAANTLGAVVGVLATAFYFIPKLGLINTSAICIVLNLICAVASLVILPQQSETAKLPLSQNSSAQRSALVRLTITGLLGIGYEVLVVRVLSQVAEDTVYTFAMLLAVYLLGSTFGAAAYQCWSVRFNNQVKLSDRLLSALTVACLLGTASLWAAELVKLTMQHALGSSMVSAVGIEATLAVMAFALPTLIMGALFSHLCAVANASGLSFGRSIGMNTLGAAAAPIVFGVIMTPALGPKWVLLIIAFAYLLLISKKTWFSPIFWLPASFALLLAFLAPPLAFVDIPEGGHIVSYQDGVMAAVSVVEDAEGVRRLRINNRQQEGNSSTLLVDGRQALLPVLLHPAPHHALFLGLGTGMTASTAAEDPTLQVDAVELLPEVVEASQYFKEAFADQGRNSRLQVMVADARRYVQSSRKYYDVIVSDNFHPARSGSGALYTIEHFTAVRARLSAGGVFCQWLPLHQLDLESLRSIVQSFIAVYPHGWAILASNSLETPVLGLVGRSDDQKFDLEGLRKRLASAAFPKSPADFAIEDQFALLGNFVAGADALARFAGHAAANTDDHPVVAYSAPRITYVPESLPRDRLITLLHELSITPEEIATTFPDDNSWSLRMANYWSARNRYIEVGRNVRPSVDVKDMLSQVREPLLSILRISPDFRPAYDPLLRMATFLGRTNPQAASELLAELIRIQPARNEAGLALDKLTEIKAD